MPQESEGTTPERLASPVSPAAPAESPGADPAGVSGPADAFDLTDPRAIKAIAHPARWRIVEELYTGRTLTATEAGALVGLSGSAMSYHLRTLARYGLVEQGESTDGRERPWQRTARSLNMSEARHTPLLRPLLATILNSLQRMADTSLDGDENALALTRGRLRMTDEQARELDRRVLELIKDFENTDELPTGPGAPPVRDFYWIRGLPSD